MTKSVTITARITPALNRKLTAYAKAAKRTKSQAVEMILDSNVEWEQAVVDAVQKGIESADRGDVVPHEEAMRQIRAHIAKRKRERRKAA